MGWEECWLIGLVCGLICRVVYEVVNYDRVTVSKWALTMVLLTMLVLIVIFTTEALIRVLFV